MSALPGYSDVNLFRYCQGVIYFNTEISDRAFDLGVAEQKLDSPKIARASIDQSGLRASERVCSEKAWIQPNAANPLRNEAGILPSCHAAFGTTTTCEQELAGLFVGGLQIIVDRLAGLFAQFESDRPSSFLLSDGCAIRRVSACSNTLSDSPACHKVPGFKYCTRRILGGVSGSREFSAQRPCDEVHDNRDGCCGSDSSNSLRCSC
jgi:hypothetical protein